MNNIDNDHHKKEAVDLPRVLVISHNPFSDTQNNGKTLTALFKAWESDKLAQLYLTTDVPDFSLCKKYFQINDFDIFKRLFKKQIQGREIRSSDLSKMQMKKQGITKNPALKVLRQNVSPFLRFLRDMMWQVAGYKTRDLIKFIDDFDPQIVFLVCSNGVFAFELTRWICERKKLPLVMQITDDYVTGKFTANPFYWLHLIRLKHVFQCACLYSISIIAIGDKMVREYRSRFGGNYFIAMNTSGQLNLPVYASSNKTIKFVYAGNLGLNRWKVLASIADCLAELADEEGLNGELSVYSLINPGDKEISSLNKPPFSYFKGALNTDELIKEKAGADVLVHVESFDRKNRHITRLSVSTKIPEYLASGRCIFAVGPSDVASMEYLAENDLGILSTSGEKCDIKRATREVMINGNKRLYYALKALEIARTRHNADDVALSIVQIISNAAKPS
jgi:hypothetical protein